MEAQHSGRSISRGAPMLRRTGQAWKLQLWLVLLAAGGGLTFIGGQGFQSSWGPKALFGGMVLGIGAFAWGAWSIACPRCGAKLWWLAMNGKHALGQREDCIKCGYAPPPLPNEVV
jgi:predicted RNA-binding Zn-ribbon protein involved in translation (DUF1610 family)